MENLLVGLLALINGSGILFSLTLIHPAFFFAGLFILFILWVVYLARQLSKAINEIDEYTEWDD